MVEDGKVVANVSVNRCDMVFDGKVARLIQLGTVMTDPDYRGKGYAGALMRRILDDYKDKVDGIYLYANDSVREFYPKYGFKERTEYQFSRELSDKTEASKKPMGKAVAFSMNGKQDWDKMEEILRNKAQNSRVYMVNNTGLYLFYLSQFMQENVFYLPDSDTYVIAEKEEDTLILHAVIGDGGIDEVIAALRGDAKRVVLMFTPKNPAGFTKQELHEQDTTFFVQGKFFEENDSEEFMFQAVTHA
jgi:predicted acetyltransferase